MEHCRFKMHSLISTTLLLLLQSVLFATAFAARNNCKGGSFFDSSSCKLCPPGTYQDEVKATSCKPCPRGSFNPISGILGMDVCRPCPAGTFSRKISATSERDCKPCPNGTSSVSGSNNCVACPMGTFISTNAAFRTDRKSICKDCSFFGITSTGDYFSNTKNSLECKRCPRGTVPMRNFTVCSPCPPGFGIDSGECERCSFGEYSDGTTECKEYPAGLKPSRRKAASKYIPCPPGTTSSFGRCTPCKEGENKNSIGAPFCVPPDTPCPSQYFLNDQRACETCKKGDRFDKVNNRCVSCGKMAESDEGESAQCRRCPQSKIGSPNGCICLPGYETLENGSCFPCPPGILYEPKGNPGSFEPGMRCISCFPNEFSKPRALKCTRCPPGKIRKPDKTGCEDCPKGTRFVDARGITSNIAECVDLRTNCAPGEERVVLKDGTLTGCQPTSCAKNSIEIIKRGSFLRNPIRRRCLDCSPGEFADLRSGFCERCPDDSVSVGGTVRKCEQCPKNLSRLPDYYGGINRSPEDGAKCGCISRGSETTGIIDGKCKTCPRGNFGLESFPVCKSCPTGFTTRRKGSQITDCEPCRKGFVADRSGRCKICPLGTTSFGVGDTTCVVIGSLKKK